MPSFEFKFVNIVISNYTTDLAFPDSRGVTFYWLVQIMSLLPVYFTLCCITMKISIVSKVICFLFVTRRSTCLVILLVGVAI